LIAAALVVLGGGAVFFMKRGNSTAPPPEAAEITSEPVKALAAAESDAPKEVKSEPPAMPVVVQTDPNAPKGSPLSKLPVVSHAGHHYQVVGQEMSLREAQQHAESLGAHLLTITSQEEMEWLDQASTAVDGHHRRLA
jgi:Tfp pilus assembly protein FimV